MEASAVRVEKVEEIISRLGENDRPLVEYLAKRRHATTQELAQLLQISLAEVPLQIERKVNPAARRIVGKDFVVFRNSWFDAESGECIQNSWWLTCPLESIGSPHRPVVEHLEKWVTSGCHPVGW